MRPLLIAAALLTSASLLGCANLCARKDRFMMNACVGTPVAYTPDPMCESKLENCSDAHLRQFEGYVACLESMGECSLEALNTCRERFPGGVNLACGGA